MDGFKEKKWFVYLVDHHEGPFSLEEIQGRLSQGQLSGTSYVWADGMADWKMMTEVEMFDSILKTGAERTIPSLTMPHLIRDEPLQSLSDGPSIGTGRKLETEPSGFHRQQQQQQSEQQSATLFSTGELSSKISLQFLWILPLIPAVDLFRPLIPSITTLRKNRAAASKEF
jgi:hypothetical protein